MASIMFCALSGLLEEASDCKNEEDAEFLYNLVGFLNEIFIVTDPMEYDKEKLIEYIKNRE